MKHTVSLKESTRASFELLTKAGRYLGRDKIMAQSWLDSQDSIGSGCGAESLLSAGEGQAGR